MKKALSEGNYYWQLTPLTPYKRFVQFGSFVIKAFPASSNHFHRLDPTLKLVVFLWSPIESLHMMAQPREPCGPSRQRPLWPIAGVMKVRDWGHFDLESLGGCL